MNDPNQPAAAVHSRGGDDVPQPDLTAGGVPGQQRAGQPRLLEVDGLSRAFGETRALVSATLAVDAGEIHALVGENGSGKTTLIKILSGALRADAGQIAWDGGPVRVPSPRAAQALGISTVFQETLVASELSVRHNIFLGTDRMFSRGQSANEEYRLAAAALADLGLEGLDPDRPLWTLTLAERQIVTIARAIIRPWRLLVLDEATSALDASQRDRLFDYLRAARAQSRSVVFTSHRMDEVSVLADTVTVLRMGSTAGRTAMAETTPRQILSAMADPEKVTQALGDSRGRVRQAAAETGPAVLRATEVRLAPGASPVTISVHRGEILGLAGLEGQGQVEFAQALCGMDGHVGGTVEVADEAGRWRTIRRRGDARRGAIAYVPRDRKQEGLFFPLSILDNFGLALFGRLSVAGVIRRGAVRRQFSETAQRLRLTPHRSGALVGVLSGGNQQKVLLGRWLLVRPRILILDEPTRGVDVGAKAEIHQLISRLASQGTAVLMISSELPEILGVSHRIMVMHEGRVTGLLPREQADQVTIMSLAAR
jgi:ABC-type sugar transport system ATPase subunit